MYGYKKYIPLEVEEILKRVSQEDIFKIIIKEEIVLDKGALYKAPYRADTIGECYFMEYEGIIYFVDFADGEGVKPSNSAIFFLMKCLRLPFKETLEYINNHFNLGLGNSSHELKEATIEHSIILKEKFCESIKINKSITYATRKFNDKDRQFWSKYGISKQNLIDDKVIPIAAYIAYSRKNEMFSITPFDIAYAYTDFSGQESEYEKVKIYRPYAQVRESKWFTNCNQDDIGSHLHLPMKGKLLIITKSYKDCRVLRNHGLASIWLQNEGQIPSTKVLKAYATRFEKIIIWFDNDQTGITKGRILTDIINSFFPNKTIQIFLPPKLLKEGIKDPSDCIDKNKTFFYQFLREQKLIV